MGFYRVLGSFYVYEGTKVGSGISSETGRSEEKKMQKAEREGGRKRREGLGKGERNK